MEVWFRNRSSEFSIGQLPEVGFIRVVVIGLEITKRRWQGIRPVIGDGDGLRVGQLHERLDIEAIVRVRAVALGRGDVGSVGERFSGEQTHLGVMAAFRKVVACLQSVFPSTEIAGGTRGEVIGKTQKYLGTESLQESPPGFTRQRGLERTDALRRDDWNALWLAGQTEEFFITGGLALPDRRKMLVFVAKKENLTEIGLSILLHLWNAIQNGALEIELQHDAQGLGEAGIHRDRKVERGEAAILDKPR